MATITKTLINGLTDQMVQARLNTVDAKQFTYGFHFPVKRIVGFNWKTLTNRLSAINVAADLHADNGTIVRKKRPNFQIAQGDLPFVAISREKTRSELKDYQTAAGLAQGADASELVDFWGEDVDFCFNGVNSELEYIAWALVSNGGKLAFTTGNNATFANQFDLDYQVADAQKRATGTDWDNSSTADVIGDLRTIVKAAKDMKLNPKFAFINMDEAYRICNAEQVIKACASFANNALGISQTPTIEQVNQMLARQAWLYGLQLRVIDQTITREAQDGSQTSANPFANRRMVISETERLGTTQYDILQENTPAILRATRTHVTVKKYGTVEPTTEVTIGEADAIPVLDTAYRNLYVRTDGNAWS